ncbi:oocyte zinc finger protein XlCOF7.1-like isoform X2 [Hyla sarda]|uniref:oocyte zinc finger protein XlCOF7.1-like isoform X2 n=1 Tax=Hyla sarda TaxID=327740 RepID=UPI0024C217DE|nr:oocyte zinc finger protein XlCOF7.1-like isoform X2 [Hyla sarda]
MERDRNKMADRIIDLTLQILFRLTGEDYTVMKKSSSGRCWAPVWEGWGRTLSPVPGPPPHSLIHEEMEEQKILELINKMMELLTGEVPIRCQDVAVYFSMEEWEYVEGHKDQYKDQVMMEDQQPLTSAVRSSKRTAAERCPRPLLPQDQGEDLIYNNATDVKEEEETDVNGDEQYKVDIPTGRDLIYVNVTNVKEEEETDVRGDEQYKVDFPTGKDLSYINATDINKEEETDVSSDEQYKEDIPTGNRPDDCTGRSEENLISSDYKADDDITQDTYEEHSIIPDTPSALHSQDLSSHPVIPVLSSDPSQAGKQRKSQRSVVIHRKAYTEMEPFSCLECRKCFNYKSGLVEHQRTHTLEKPFICPECGKCFAQIYNLVKHQRSHTVLKALIFGDGERAGQSSQGTGVISATIVPGQHFPGEVPHTGKKGRSQKKCRVCRRRGIRKDTTYQCDTCPDNPGLCIKDCFREYHTSMQY